MNRFYATCSQDSEFQPDLPTLVNVTVILLLGEEKALGIWRNTVFCTLFSILNCFPTPRPGLPLQVCLCDSFQLSNNGSLLSCLGRPALQQSSIRHRGDSVNLSAVCHHHALTCNSRPEDVSLLVILDVLMNVVSLQKLSKTL